MKRAVRNQTRYGLQKGSTNWFLKKQFRDIKQLFSQPGIMLCFTNQKMLYFSVTIGVAELLPQDSTALSENVTL